MSPAPCWPWLQPHVGHGTSTTLAMAPALRWPWLQHCWPWCQHHVGHDASTTLAMAPGALQDLHHPWRQFRHKAHLYPGKEMGPPRWGTAENRSCMCLCPGFIRGYLILARNKGSCCALPLQRGWEK